MKKIILVFLISMVPVVELRGALPYALGPWMGQPLPLLQAYLICIIGNMLPVPLIYLFARKLLEWGKDKPLIGKPFTWCLEKGKKGGEALQKKAGQGLFLALMLFVGIPLPGRAHLPPAFWIWNLRKACLRLCLAFCLQESSCSCFQRPDTESSGWLPEGESDFRMRNDRDGCLRPN